MKSTKVLLSVLGVAVLSACSTVSVKDTSGVTATNRMFNYYLEQTKQAFNDLAEHEHTTTYHVNEQLIEQSVLNAAARVDEANDLLGNTPAVEPKGAVMAAAEEVEAIVPAAKEEPVAASVKPAPVPAKTVSHDASVARFIPLDDERPAPNSLVGTYADIKTAPVLTQAQTNFVEMVSADVIKQTKDGACLAVKGTSSAAQGALGKSVSVKAYTGSLEEVLELVAKQIGYDVLPSAGLMTQPVVVTYSAECTQAKAAFLEIGALAGGEIKVAIDEAGKSVQVRYPSGNTYAQ